LDVRSSDKIAVVGPGRLGMLAGRALALTGARVSMLGRRPKSLALARAWGLDAALVDEVADSEFDIVVDTSGHPEGLAHALRLVRPLGTLVMKSTFAGPSRVDLSKVVVAEITVLGSRCGPFAPALGLLAGGEVAVDDLVDGEYGLADGEAAFAHAARAGARKILLRP
jgi:threonine dehydrogenase-like Zn-dependent dehydrogenase